MPAVRGRGCIKFTKRGAVFSVATLQMPSAVPRAFVPKQLTGEMRQEAAVILSTIADRGESFVDVLADSEGLGPVRPVGTGTLSWK